MALLYHHFENGCFMADSQTVLDIRDDLGATMNGMQGSDRKVPHRTECIFTARTVVYAIVCRIIIAERRGVRYVYSSNLQNKRFLYGQNA